MAKETATNNHIAEKVTKTLVDWAAEVPSLLPDSLLFYWNIMAKHHWVFAIVVIVIFWLIAFIIKRNLGILLDILSRKTQTKTDDIILETIQRPIYLSIIVSGLLIACNILSLKDSYLLEILITFAIYQWITAGLALCQRLFTVVFVQSRRLKSVNRQTAPLYIIVSKILVLLIGCYLVLHIWGINPFGLLASAGIVGIAVGFAAKDSLSNLFSGIFILTDRPYRLGDYVSLDSGERGKITHIGIRSTRILTRDDVEIVIPNGVIGNAKVINESGGIQEKIRIKLPLEVAYGSDLPQVESILSNIATDDEEICDYPLPRVRVRGFANSGVSIDLLCWIDKPENKGRARHILYCEIYAQFQKHNIEIPYPRRDVHVFTES